MPRRRPATAEDIKDFVRAKMADKTAEELLSLLPELEYEESNFEDPGSDYTALVLDNEQLAFWKGY